MWNKIICQAIAWAASVRIWIARLIIIIRF